MVIGTPSMTRLQATLKSVVWTHADTWRGESEKGSMLIERSAVSPQHRPTTAALPGMRGAHKPAPPRPCRTAA
jgi:hypothetical protein